MTVWVTTTPSPCVLYKEMGTLVPGVRGISKSEGYKIHGVLMGGLYHHMWNIDPLCLVRFCRGCIIVCNDDRAIVGNACIAVDWDPTALHLRYQTSQERVSYE